MKNYYLKLVVAAMDNPEIVPALRKLQAALANHGVNKHIWPEVGDKVLRLAEATIDSDIRVSTDMSPEMRLIIDIYQEFAR